MVVPGRYEAIDDVARSMARQVLEPAVTAAEPEGEFPESVWDQLADAGLTGVGVPTDLGGIAADRFARTLVYERLGHAHLAVSTALSVHDLATTCLTSANDDGAWDDLLRSMAGGRPVGAFSLSEPQAGSDPSAIRTVARPVEDGYEITGEKLWVTNGRRADLVVLFARTPDVDGGITQFLVPADAAGFSPGPPLEKLGLRASDTTALDLDEVSVPESHRLTPIGDGLAAAFDALAGGRISIAAQSVGLAQAAIDETRASLTATDRNVKASEHARHTLAEMSTRVAAARSLTRDAARVADAGEDARYVASRAKLFASETAVWVTRNAIDLHGQIGYTTSRPVERYYRDARVTTIYEGTSQIQRMILARELLGRE